MWFVARGDGVSGRGKGPVARSRSLRHSRSVLLTAAVMVTVIVSTPAIAGNITLELLSQAELRETALVVRLAVRNSGDEAGRSMRAALVFRNRTVRSEVRPLLNPAETWEVALAMTDVEVGTGQWPYRITVDYVDANGYPFQALHVGALAVGSPPPPKVAVRAVTTPPLSTTGTLTSHVKNLSPDPMVVSIAVHLPEGIELAAPPPSVELEAREEQRVTASLVNRAGLPGSRYAVFVSAEYNDGPVHHAVVVPTTVEIVAKHWVFERWRILMWVAAGILVLAWGVAVSWRLAVRSRSFVDTSPD
jgi:hypothetical protein